MKLAIAPLAALLATGIPQLAYADDVAPGGTLRAVYLGSNPAQAVRDAATGEIRGASADLARELAKRSGVPLDFKAEPIRRLSSKPSRPARPISALWHTRRPGSGRSSFPRPTC